MVFSRNHRTAEILLESSVTGNAEEFGVAKIHCRAHGFTLDRLCGQVGSILATRVTAGGIGMPCRQEKCLTFCFCYIIFPCNVLLNRHEAEKKLVLRRVSANLN